MGSGLVWENLTPYLLLPKQDGASLADLIHDCPYPMGDCGWPDQLQGKWVKSYGLQYLGGHFYFNEVQYAKWESSQSDLRIQGLSPETLSCTILRKRVISFRLQPIRISFDRSNGAKAWWCMTYPESITPYFINVRTAARLYPTFLILTASIYSNRIPA